MCSYMNKLFNVLSKTGGRFTTLVVDSAKGRQSYCARIEKLTEKTVTFFDINSKMSRRVNADTISLARSGKATYRRARVRR